MSLIVKIDKICYHIIMISGYIVYNYGGGFIVFWSVQNLNLNENDIFKIYRKNAESEDFKYIGETDIHHNHFVDYYPNISYQVRPIYQVQIERNGQVIDSSNPIVMDDIHQDQDVRYRMIQNAYRIGLDKSFGNKIYVLTRKTWGPKCLCTQNPRGFPSGTVCEICYGTGYIGGFYAPVLTRAEKQNTAKYFQNNMFTLEPQDVVFRIMNYPLCKTGDIVVTSNNERFEILSVRPTYIQDKLVSQLIQIRRASGTGRLIYKLRVDLKDLQPDTYVSWRPL